MWTVENRKSYERKGQRYPSDLSDDERALVEPHLPPPRQRSRHPSPERRLMLDAILYVFTTGCQWRGLPKDSPPKSTVHGYFVDWHCDGTLTRIHNALYCEVPELAGGLRRVCAVLLHAGASGRPPGSYTLDMLADDAIGLIDVLGIDGVHFAGVSMGGMIGQTVALSHPERLASLALINTTPVYSDAQRIAWRERADVVLRDGIASVHGGLMRRWFTDEAIAGGNAGYRYIAEMAHRFSPQSFDAVTAAMCQLDTTKRLGEISAPTLVVAAPDDPGVSPELSEKLAQDIPNAELHWLTPARHLATLEHVEAFNRLLRAHLMITAHAT